VASSRASGRLGSELPRIFTPPLRELTPQTSAGFRCIDFAEQVLEVNLIPWQRWLLIHALELLEDGTFRFRTVVVLIARQNGKSTLARILALFFMYVRAASLVIGTAQNLDIAEEVWQGAVDIAEDVAELADEIERVVRVNGKKALELRSGERYKVQAANRRGGRGLSGDLVIMDELREHQSWDSWSAVTKTTLARMLAQIWALSNAGDVASIVLAHLRRMAHASLGDPDGINRDLPTVVEIEVPADLEDVPDDSLGIFEWSAPPGCAIEDRDGWANANPSLGYTITERAIASAMRTDPEWVFRTEVLCQWSAGTLEGPFPPGKWDDCLDTSSSIANATVLGVGVDVSADRSMTHIALAGYNQAGRIHVEIVASRYGTEWVTDYLTAGADVRNFCGIALQSRSAPCSPLVDELAAADLPVLEWQGPDMTAGTGKFYDLVRNSELVHLQQQVLDVAAATAVTKPAGDAWLWNRKQSPTDIAPLVAATAAVWALLNKPVEVVSAYEESELTIA
jgi:hypothetical protein